MAENNAKEKIKGIFSSQTIQKVGTGTTTRKTVKKTFWSAEELEDGQIEIQPLNMNYIPSGPKKKVTKDEFLEKFAPEMEFYVSTVYPKMQELDESVNKADEHRQNGEHFSAELEYGQAINLDTENVRANFGLGLTYLERGDDTRANDIFERLVKLEAAFEEEHKHLFNEFGINLRKNAMLDQSVDYYQRAIELSGKDENLYYNIARVYYEQEKFKDVVENLTKALEMNSDFKEARQFMDFMINKGFVGEEVYDSIDSAESAPATPAKPQAAPSSNVPAPDSSSSANTDDMPAADSDAIEI